MDQRTTTGHNFLWIDDSPERLAKVRAGEVVVAPLNSRNPKMVPAGLIHDWVGAVFIPRVHLAEALDVVRSYSHYKEIYHPTVVNSTAIDQRDTEDRFSMLLRSNSFFDKSVLDIEYAVRYTPLDEHRTYCISQTTRVQQIDDYGSPAQRVLPKDEGAGFIWRMVSVTRFAERDGGVYMELEAIALSRDIPASLRWLVDPIVRRMARASLATFLRQTDEAVKTRTKLATR